jgi:hypothetical protein
MNGHDSCSCAGDLAVHPLFTKAVLRGAFHGAERRSAPRLHSSLRPRDRQRPEIRSALPDVRLPATYVRLRDPARRQVTRSAPSARGRPAVVARSIEQARKHAARESTRLDATAKPIDAVAAACELDRIPSLVAQYRRPTGTDI